MRILHISDFHYKAAEREVAKQNLLVDSLLESLNNVEPIDFLLFTGDLVFSGKNKKDFDEAYKSLIVRIGKKLNLKGRQIFFCPGNHDVDRDLVSEPVKKYIRDFKDNDELSKFVIANAPNSFGQSLESTKNYYEFLSNLYKSSNGLFEDTIQPLYTTHIREYECWKIGFVTINTAWCSTGDDDKGNLFFPKEQIEIALEKLKQSKVDWKILLLHHPLNDLRDFNKLDIEDLIYSEFHMMFSGHLHKREDFIKLTFNEGIFGSYAHAAFTKKGDGKIGYSIFDIDLNTLDIKIKKRFYDFDERVFLKGDNLETTFPHNQIKKTQIKIYKTLRKRLLEFIEKADDLFVTKDLISNKGFIDLFVDPVLKEKADFEVINHLNSQGRFNNKDLFNGVNYLIYGKDKTGKTSLLYRIKIEILKNYSHSGEIPFYIDLNEHKTNPNKLDIKKLFTRFIECTKEESDSILKTYRIKILFDNFDPSNSGIIKKVADFINENSNCTFIIVASQTLARSYENIDYGFSGYKSLYIHDIARSEIRQLTKKWPNIPSDKQDDFIDKIIEVMKQHGMPFNFWTLSIFLWIFSAKRTLIFNNNSELIELYIDDILDRNGLASNSQNRFSYNNYKVLLSELANNLLINYSNSNYSISYNSLIQFVSNFMKENPRRVGLTSEVVSYLLDKNILKKIDNDYIVFRLNGVFEYFIAFNFNENKEFLNDIIADDNFYLSFKNEFEIYSGFAHTVEHNTAFLNLIYEKTKNVFSDLNNSMQEELDVRLNKSIEGKELLDLSQPINEIADAYNVVPLTNEEKDELIEATSTTNTMVEVKPKRIYDISVKNFEILETYLFINGRVFRNIDNVKDSTLVEEVFDFILESSCNLGFLLLTELESRDFEIEDFKIKDPNKVLFKLFNNYLPCVVQMLIQNTVAHVNLEVIILEKIRKLKENSSINQYRLFILYSLLLDIDLKKHKRVISEFIQMSKSGIIRSSLLVKLFNLLILKSYDDDEMITFLKERIKELRLKINPKLKATDIENSFDKTHKMILLKRQLKSRE